VSPVVNTVVEVNERGLELLAEVAARLEQHSASALGPPEYRHTPRASATLLEQD
jgi:hypothetical protein